MRKATPSNERRVPSLGARRFAFLMSSCLAASALTGCGSEATTDESGEEVAPIAPPPVVELPEPPPPDRGPDGALLESDEMVVGVHLPRGLRVIASEERHHAYEGNYPPELYVRYFGPRVTTGNVQRHEDGGANYRQAVPREDVGVIPFDLMITSATGGHSLIVIDQLQAPIPGQTREDIERALQEIAEEDVHGPRTPANAAPQGPQ